MIHLTPRQKEILFLAARGYTNAEIGRRVHLTTKTISNVMGHVERELHARNRTEAVVTAIRAGLVPLPRRPLARCPTCGHLVRVQRVTQTRTWHGERGWTL